MGYGLPLKKGVENSGRDPHGTQLVQTANMTIYATAECLHTVSSIDWGSVAAGSSTSVTVYVQIAGNTDVKLLLTTEHWNSEDAQRYIHLDWDYAGGKIKAGQVVPTTLTLTVADDVHNVTHFTFDVVGTSMQATGKKQ